MTNDSFKSLRVLVAEDEAFSRKIVAAILADLGVNNVTFAVNGMESLDKLASVPELIDLVISDIEMPDMDGFELARRIRAGVVPRYKDVPFLMLTGHDTEDYIRKCRVHHVQGFIVKPPNAEILERNMMRALKLT